MYAVQFFLRGVLFIIFASSGIGHFIAKDFYLRLVPPYIPFAEAVVAITGVLVILMGVGIITPGIKKFTAKAMVAFTLCTMPSIVYLISHAELFPELSLHLMVMTIPTQISIFISSYWLSGMHSPVYFFEKYAHLDEDYVKRIDKEREDKEEKESKAS
ncbi:MAG: hypothetical protein OEY33_06770 [Bdellovibrionales bacterium]|nr:hypothetical protein [Bdellovibrionales bacterium]